MNNVTNETATTIPKLTARARLGCYVELVEENGNVYDMAVLSGYDLAAKLALAWNTLADAERLARAVLDDPRCGASLRPYALAICAAFAPAGGAEGKR